MIFTLSTKQILLLSTVVALLSPASCLLLTANQATTMAHEIDTNDHNDLYGNNHVISARGLRGENRTLIQKEEQKYPWIPEHSGSSWPERIIGGSNVPANTYPFFARGTYNNHQDWWGCAGSLVTSEFVLSAGELWSRTSVASSCVIIILSFLASLTVLSIKSLLHTCVCSTLFLGCRWRVPDWSTLFSI